MVKRIKGSQEPEGFCHILLDTTYAGPLGTAAPGDIVLCKEETGEQLVVSMNAKQVCVKRIPKGTIVNTQMKEVNPDLIGAYTVDGSFIKIIREIKSLSTKFANYGLKETTGDD